MLREVWKVTQRASIRAMQARLYANDVRDEMVPIERAKPDPSIKTVEQFVHPPEPKVGWITQSDVRDEAMDIAGVPEEHVVQRRARIFKPARAMTMQGWNNTKLWKVKLDTRERWDNPLMGWTSSGDPQSNLQLDFSSKEDAIRFCEKNRWEFEVEQEHVRKIVPKAYGSNFSWNERTRTNAK
uniref:NADH dehydrogenase [ubiquinone] iron-sulfur protein 4, mitochondrial n=1 Tax=Plectus sambesii TaxID=2011161 RepID=A0A914WDE8_9BILA